MKERPILFNAPMVRAILEGRKTQTRRVVKPQPVADRTYRSGYYLHKPGDRRERRISTDAPALLADLCPYGKPGDRLWVRETFAIENTSEYASEPGIAPPLGPVRDNPWEIGGQLIPRYRASEPETALMIAPSEHDDIGMRWTPSIHMPRWASRILLEVTDVRVERLQQCSEDNAIAEGCRWVGTDKGRDYYSAQSYPPGIKVEVFSPQGAPTARGAYAALWDSINGAGAWDANPWVWVVSFRQVQP